MSFVFLILVAGGLYYSLNSYLRSKDRLWLYSSRCCGFFGLILIILVTGILNMIIAVLVGAIFVFLNHERKSHAFWCRPAAAASSGLATLIAIINLTLNINQTHNDIVIPENSVVYRKQ